MRRLLAAAMALAMVLVLGAVPALGADTFEPVVLIDNDGIAVTVTGYDPEGDNGPAFDLLLENKTDSDMDFFAEGLAVNGVMSDVFWANSVEAGAEASCRLELFTYPEKQAALGIRYVRDVQIYLTVLSLSEIDAGYHEVFRGLASWSVPGTEDQGPAVEEPVNSDFAPVRVMDSDVTAAVRDIAYAISLTAAVTSLSITLTGAKSLFTGSSTAGPWSSVPGTDQDARPRNTS